MRFPLYDRLDLPCVLEGVVPGKPHPDGRRYLPLLLLRPAAAGAPPDLLLGVVDRHHRVAEADLGRAGSARLVCALSALSAQAPPYSLGLLPEEGWAPGRASTAPVVRGRVLEVAAWEVERGHLPYEKLYAELLLDIGLGAVGLRTGVTAASIEQMIGRPRLAPGDWVELRRSRIDILAFDAAEV